MSEGNTTSSSQSNSENSSRASTPTVVEETAYQKLQKIIQETKLEGFTYEKGGQLINKVDVNLNVNSNSKFVVVTYWWGRSNDNNNTARPCISFFEEVTGAVVKFAVNYVITLYKNKKFTNVSDVPVLDNMVDNISRLAAFNKIVKKYAKVYMNMVYSNLGLSRPEYKLKPDDDLAPEQYAEVEKYNTTVKQKQYDDAKVIIEKMKRPDKTGLPDSLKIQKILASYQFSDEITTENDLREILLMAVEKTKQNIVDISHIKDQVDKLKEIYSNKVKAGYENIDEPGADNLKTAFLEATMRLKAVKKELSAKIVAELKTKKKDPPYKLNGINYDELHYTQFEIAKRGQGMIIPPFAGYNIYDILNERFRFFEPLKFEQMIKNWGIESAKYGCNYLSVEYPEFAAPGGYQMAINAKPLFIQKALELVNNKGLGVLYIDGDMFIRKYPQIFDTPNVDFMARGWWVDPRSSVRLEESIMYDPYTFETSGGTMFFSQSPEASALIKSWINASDKEYQQGKADDRILSLIFNTQKWLLTVNVIQLPIEYLWLTLDYDDRLKDVLYDWDVPRMRETIFIEHPECLTSEETATGSGASSDRSPKFYTFLDLDEAQTPVSEEAYEYVMFESQDMTYSFKAYHDYMSTAYYMDDGNEQFIKRKLVNVVDPDYNEQPLYITAYKHGYGRRQKIVDNNKRLLDSEEELNDKANVSFVEKKFDLSTQTEVGDKIEKFIRQNDKVFTNNIFKIVSLKPESITTPKNTPKVIDESYEIPTILSLLNHGYSVIYSHSETLNENDIDKALYKYVNTNLELIFFPIMGEMENNLKPVIDFNKPIIFRAFPGASLNMINKVLSMFTSLQDFSDYLTRGNYQIMSRIRMGYVFSGSKGRKLPMVGGGKRTLVSDDFGSQDQFEHEYESSFDKYYLPTVNKAVPQTKISGGRTKRNRTRRAPRKYNKRTRTRRT
jgi:hypothetical protein